MNILYIAIGSAIGGICRYGTAQLMGRLCTSYLPLGTFVVNMVGCFLIGLLYGWIDRGVNFSTEARLFLITGFCGGFTTFSSFAHENYMLFNQDKGFLMVIAYAALSFFVGLTMVYLGHKISY